MNWSTIGQIFVGIGQACALGMQVLQAHAKDQADLLSAKKELLDEFKNAYASRDKSAVLDVLRRLRGSK